MNVPAKYEDEYAGLIVVIYIGIATTVITALVAPVFEWISGPWLFVLLTTVVLGGASLLQQTEEIPPDDEVVLSVELLDWANQLVGLTCVRCEDEIKFVPLSTEEGHSEHRIECGCTVIQSSATG